MIVKQKGYVWILSVFILTGGFILHAGWEKTGNSHYDYKLTSKLSGTTSDNLISYQLSLSPPIGQFINPSSFSNCTKEADTSSNVAGKKVFDPRQASDSDYSFSMSGKISVSGTGTGTITWSANPELEKPFFVTPKTPPVAKGTSPSITFTASENADWSLGAKNNQTTVSIYVKGDPKAPTTAIKVNNGKNQTISAFPTGKTSPSDSATFTICRETDFSDLSQGFSFTVDSSLVDKLNNAISIVIKKKLDFQLSINGSYTKKELYVVTMGLLWRHNKRVAVHRYLPLLLVESKYGVLLR